MEMFIIGVGAGISITCLLSGLKSLYSERKKRRLQISKRLRIIQMI